jgi:hypothetical protein
MPLRAHARPHTGRTGVEDRCARALAAPPSSPPPLACLFRSALPCWQALAGDQAPTDRLCHCRWLGSCPSRR